MKENIQVTVLCTVYNHEKYIRQALQSIVNQKTNFAFEVIVHDDASTDGSAEIIREFESRYPAIIKPIYQSENQYSKGSPIARFMLPHARGKYIASCEGDDYWTDNEKLQRQYDFLEAHGDYVMVAHHCEIVNEKGAYIAPFSRSSKKDYERGEVIGDTDAFQTATMFYRKEARIKNQEFLSTVRLFDYALKSVLSTEGKIYILPQTMSAYRKGSDGSWTMRISHDKEKYIGHIRQSIEFYKNLDEYRDGEYSNLIQKEIRRREFNILMEERTRDASAKIIHDYRDLYNKLPFKTRAYRQLLALGLCGRRN